MSAVTSRNRVGGVIEIPWRYLPAAPELMRSSDAPAVLDHTAAGHDRGYLDDADLALVAAARAEPRLTALWRAWRVPAEGAGRVVRVVVAQGEVPDPGRVAARLRAALDGPPPLIEVCGADGQTDRQRMARSFGALLWARRPAGPLDLVPVFDRMDPGRGPWFEPDHPRLDEQEREDLVDYLEAGVPLLVTDARMDDVLDRDGELVVPLSFRTDGRYVWSDAVAYYAHRYGLAPQEGLREHARRAGYRPPEVDDVLLHRAVALLYAPGDIPAWLLPEAAGDLA